MAVPKKKTSKRNTNSRRSANDKTTARSMAICTRCQEPKLPHRVCPSCGYYKNRMVVVVKEYEG